ncbi:hypothetical protein N9M52_00645 [bacterium]|nr:hypothetical protein [bacterium]
MRENFMSTLNYDVSFDVKHIDDISTYEGFIPSGYDLVEYAKDTDPVHGFVLYGFDEVGFTAIPNAKHAFVKSGV